jgi:hypothetical protein
VQKATAASRGTASRLGMANSLSTTKSTSKGRRSEERGRAHCKVGHAAFIAAMVPVTAMCSRLVAVVEQRNQIVDCLEMDRKREVDEDQSVRERLQMLSPG